jgi:6-phospho-3-hexuloisomerase
MNLSAWLRRDLAEVTAILTAIPEASAEVLVTAILAAPRVYVLGLGRSGLIGRMFAMRLMQIGREAHVVGDVTTPAIAQGDLLIALSGSGRTETVLHLARKAQGYGARVLAITADAAAPLAELADLAVIVPASSAKSDPAAETQLPLANALEHALAIFLDCVGAMLAAQCGQDNRALMARHANLE